MLQKYNKFIVAAIGAAVSLATYFGVDNALIQIAVTAAAAIGVYLAPNVVSPGQGSGK